MPEVIPFLLRRPKAMALAVFLVCLSLSALIIWQFEQNQRHATRADVENIAQNHAFLVRDSLNQALTLNYSFAAMIRLGHGSTSRFDDAARELLPYFDSVSHISLSPNGIITQVYPLAGNEKSLGFNQLADTIQNKEAIRARDSGKLTLAGPVQLVQGGVGAIARLPIYLVDQSETKFWGFSNVTIRIDRLLKAANLSQLDTQGMAYKLWRINPETGEQDIIAVNSPEYLIDPVDKSFEVPNGSWTLSVTPIAGWTKRWQLIGEILIALVLSFLLAYQSWLMVMLQRRRLHLQEAVAEQTRELLHARAHLQATLDAIPDLLFEIDINGIIHNYHTNQPELLTVAPIKFLGKSFHLFLPEDACTIVHAALDEAAEKGMSSGKCYSLMLPRGFATFELSVSRKADEQDGIARFVVLSRDITQRKESEERINKLAFFDPLTQLPNRRLLQDRLEHAIATSLRQGKLGALLFIDLDDFKTLNDNRGHHIGDLLLIAVAERLRLAVRTQDTVARLGGDEFLVVFEGLDEDHDKAALHVQQIAEKILASLNCAYQLEGQEYFNSPSIGICLFGDKPVQIEELLKQADQAMYHAKAAGRNTLRFFDPEMQTLTAQRFALQNEIRDALQQHQFQLYYQPQINHTGTLVGAEALIRWIHPQRGMIPPLDFIPIAEESGLILPMGNWIFATACAQLVEWSKSAQTADIILSINVSARQFQHPDFVAQLLGIIEQSGAAPYKLKLELTESMLVANQQEIITKMDALKSHGIKFSLDDFGTGYSSLSYLKRLPISELKIDKSFVKDILIDPNDAAIARMIIRLAQSMELTVIAEGVETKEQRDWLEKEGCLKYQGYYFGRPVPVDKFNMSA
ncbi:bifunctional diguanylate cyclase/phosphodiesterase [Cellvibrio sp. OA-2007]|uniref:bifunctional diguanylate cyclase/phosphodiesterase n=1 Tax=Cellvibrio sp. OA-2007 TaxID=529823 RepID=UPI0007804F5A|nr:EAL domain-containing protein [Cellvibrio sp. OA-2007]